MNRFGVEWLWRTDHQSALREECGIILQLARVDSETVQQPEAGDQG